MKIFLSILLLLVAGCSAIDVQRYSGNEPRLDFFEYFTGNTRGWGIVQDRKGVLTRQFVVDILGEVQEDGRLVLREQFVWSDGEQSERRWVLTKGDEHNFTGSAPDVVDLADGTLYGNVLNWQYRLKLKVKDSIWKIHFDDWLFQVDDDMLINRATMSKFGFTVGEVTIVFRK